MESEIIRAESEKIKKPCNMREVKDENRRNIGDPKPQRRKTEYICLECNRIFLKRDGLVKHFARTTPCYELRTIGYLKEQIKKGDMDRTRDNINGAINDFEYLVSHLNRKSSAEEVATTAKSLKSMRYNLLLLKGYTNILFSDRKTLAEIWGDIEDEVIERKIEEYYRLINYYEDTLKRLIDKYRLLILV